MKRPHDIRCAYQMRGDVPDCCNVAVAFDATMAERERCVKVAERLAEFCSGNVDGSAYGPLWAARADEARNVAKALVEP